MYLLVSKEKEAWNVVAPQTQGGPVWFHPSGSSGPMPQAEEHGLAPLLSKSFSPESKSYNEDQICIKQSGSHPSIKIL